MGKKSDLSPRKIGQIKVLLQHTTLSQSDIAKKVNISQPAVAQIKKKLEFQGTASPRRVGKCGRRRKTTPNTDRWLVRQSLKNRKLSSRQLKQDLEQRGIVLDSSTVRRRLCEAGMRAYRPEKKPHLTIKMRRQHLVWAKQFQTWTSEDWSRVS